MTPVTASPIQPPISRTPFEPLSPFEATKTGKTIVRPIQSVGSHPPDGDAPVATGFHVPNSRVTEQVVSGVSQPNPPGRAAPDELTQPPLADVWNSMVRRPVGGAAAPSTPPARVYSQWEMASGATAAVRGTPQATVAEARTVRPVAPSPKMRANRCRIRVGSAPAGFEVDVSTSTQPEAPAASAGVAAQARRPGPAPQTSSTALAPSTAFAAA